MGKKSSENSGSTSLIVNSNQTRHCLCSQSGSTDLPDDTPPDQRMEPQDDNLEVRNEAANADVSAEEQAHDGAANADVGWESKPPMHALKKSQLNLFNEQWNFQARSDEEVQTSKLLVAVLTDVPESLHLEGCRLKRFQPASHPQLRLRRFVANTMLQLGGMKKGMSSILRDSCR